MRRCFKTAPIAAVLILIAISQTTSAAEPSAALQSPWDATPVTLTTARYDCGPIIHVSTDLNLSGTVPKTDPNYDRSFTALLELTHRVVKAADRFRSSGSRDAVQCIADQLAAAAGSLTIAGKMRDETAWEHQNFAINSFAVAMLKVRGSGLISPKDNTLISSWLIALVQMEVAYYTDVTKSELHCRNKKYNDGLESGDYYACVQKGDALRSHDGLNLALASVDVGVLTNDRKSYDWGIAQYKTAVSHIDKQGMLPYDTQGKHAAKFNLESAGALVSIAEFALANGENLYDYHNGAIHKLVQTAVQGITDPGVYANAAHADQVDLQQDILSWEIAWAAPYNRRYPDANIENLLEQVNLSSDYMWGGQL